MTYDPILFAGGETTTVGDTINSNFEGAADEINISLQLHPYSTLTTYDQYDLVKVNGRLYISLQASNTNHGPTTEPAWWMPLVPAGLNYFEWDGATDALEYNYSYGAIIVNGEWQIINAGTAVLADNTINYIEVDYEGNINVFDTPTHFTNNGTTRPLYIFETDSGEITNWADLRNGFDFGDLLPVTLTDAAPIVVDAGKGCLFDITLTASGHELSNPINARDGQILIFRIRPATYSLIFPASGSKYRCAPGKIADVDDTGPTLSTDAGALDRLIVEYCAADDKFDVVEFTPGYGT